MHNKDKETKDIKGMKSIASVTAVYHTRKKSRSSEIRPEIDERSRHSIIHLPALSAEDTGVDR